MAPQDPNAPTDSSGTGLLVAAAVTLVISWLSVGLRTYVRAGMMSSFQIDDWVMLAGLANFTVSCSFIFAGIYWGLGRHNKSLSQHDEIEALKYQALATASYVSNMWLIKLSIGLFLFRLAVRRRYQYILGISIGVVGVWSLVLFFWNIFQCRPVAAQWDYTILERDLDARCVSVDEVVSAAYALSILTILSDWLYALLPIPMLWEVKMSAQAKWSVTAVLGLGIFASVATLIRLAFLADLTDVADILYSGTNAMIWTLVEPGIAISAASLATIRPLLRRLRIRGFTHSERSDGVSGGPSQDLNQQNQKQGGSSSRSKGGSHKMPGFGPNDVTLVDIEAGTHSELSATPYHHNDTSTTSPHLSTAFNLSSSKPPRTTAGVTWRTDIKSETYIFENDAASQEPDMSEHHSHTTPGAWLDQESDSSSLELTRSSRDIVPMPLPVRSARHIAGYMRT